MKPRALIRQIAMIIRAWSPIKNMQRLLITQHVFQTHLKRIIVILQVLP